MLLENRIPHNLLDYNYENLKYKYYFIIYTKYPNIRQLRNDGENICVLSIMDNDEPYLPISAPPGISYSRL
jgi:hypothetical protein